ncbi:MAG: branched-chain amino acid aminotransferase [Propionibacteriaceae bacterium]|jgi:branched-chain amino acid aminotransferase|nr:branched-chain amino acid aminotransferase [Propionibacteriaceae bacterium]
MSLRFELATSPTYTSDARIAEINVDPGFGVYFSDHMAVAAYNETDGWVNARVEPYADFAIAPASAVLHYAQEVFEGLKAYRHADGSVWLFRPEANAERLARSAKRLALPELPVADFVASVRAVVELDERWVPSSGEQSLYIRPFMIGSESFLGVRASKTVTYFCIAGPVGAYFSGGVKPVDIWVSNELSRVPNGGTGSAKCGGNYATSLLAQNEAYAQGCSQVLFTDAATHSVIEELGGMNFMFINTAGELVTPELNGNILPGITRDSLLKLAPSLGLTPVERRITLAEVYSGLADGSIVEAFACGTAAVITPIGSLKDGATGEVHRALIADFPKAMGLRALLLDIQYGRVPDPFGWTQQVV